MGDRLKEIEIAAKGGYKKHKPPEKMSLAECLYYQQMCGVYAEFNCKAISLDEARQKKQTAINSYKDFAQWERIFKWHIEINNELEKLIEPVGDIDRLSKEELIERFKTIQAVLQGCFGGKNEN
jgi:hypothetical protein